MMKKKDSIGIGVLDDELRDGLRSIQSRSWAAWWRSKSGSLQDRVLETPPASPSRSPDSRYLSDEDELSRRRGPPDMSVFRDAVQDCLDYDHKSARKTVKSKQISASNDSEAEKYSGLRIRLVAGMTGRGGENPELLLLLLLNTGIRIMIMVVDSAEVKSCGLIKLELQR